MYLTTNHSWSTFAYIVCTILKTIKYAATIKYARTSQNTAKFRDLYLLGKHNRRSEIRAWCPQNGLVVGVKLRQLPLQNIAPFSNVFHYHERSVVCASVASTPQNFGHSRKLSNTSNRNIKKCHLHYTTSYYFLAKIGHKSPVVDWLLKPIRPKYRQTGPISSGVTRNSGTTGQPNRAIRIPGPLPIPVLPSVSSTFCHFVPRSLLFSLPILC